MNKSKKSKINQFRKSNQKFLFNKQKIIKWFLYSCKDKEPKKNYIINKFKKSRDHINDMKLLIDKYKIIYKKYLTKKKGTHKNKENSEDNIYLFLMRNFKTEKEKKILFSDRVLFCLLKFNFLIDNLKNKINLGNIVLGDYGSKNFNSDIDFNFELLSINDNSMDIYELMFYLEQEIYVNKLYSYPEFWNIEYYANLYPTDEIIKRNNQVFKLPLNIPMYKDNNKYSKIKNTLFILTIGAMIRNMIQSGLKQKEIFKILDRLFNKDINIIKKEVIKYYILPNTSNFSFINNENKVDLFTYILNNHNKTYKYNINKIKTRFNSIKNFLDKKFKEKSLLYLSSLKSVCLLRNKLKENLDDPIKIFEYFIKKSEKLLLREESYILLQSIYLIVNVIQENKLNYIKKINDKYDYMLLLLEQFGYIIRFNIMYCNKLNIDNSRCLLKVNKYKKRFHEGLNIYNILNIIKNNKYKYKKSIKQNIINLNIKNSKISKKVLKYHIKKKQKQSRKSK